MYICNVIRQKQFKTGQIAMTEQEQNIADFQKCLKQADECIDFAAQARKEGRLNDAWEDIQEADKYFKEALRAQEYVTKEYLNQFQKLR